VHIYRHRDARHLSELLRQGNTFRRRLIVTDSLFSMEGDIAPLAELAPLAQEFGAMLMVDEAHATGVFGPRGRGVCEVQGVEDLVPVRVGTLSKALGSMGGFVVGSQRLIDWLTNRARPYFFSTAAPAPVAAAGRKALEIVQREPERRTGLLEMSGKLRRRLVARGLVCSASESQTIPVVLGDPNRTMAAAAKLRRRGFFVPGIRPPSVPAGQSLLRISLTALHREHQIDDLVAALCEVAR